MVILSTGAVRAQSAGHRTRSRQFLPAMVPHKRKEPLKAWPDWHNGLVFRLPLAGEGGAGAPDEGPRLQARVAASPPTRVRAPALIRPSGTFSHAGAREKENACSQG